MLGIPTLQVLFDLVIAPVPEADEIAGNLHGSPRGRQQLQQQRQATGRHAGRYAHAEHLLQAHRQGGDLAVHVIDGDARTAGDHEMRRRLLVKDAVLRVRQASAQGIVEVQASKVLATYHAGHPGRRPLLESSVEGGIAQVGPGLGSGYLEL